MANGTGKIVIVPRPRKALLRDIRPEHSWRSDLLASWERGFEEFRCAAPETVTATVGHEPTDCGTMSPDSR